MRLIFKIGKIIQNISNMFMINFLLNSKVNNSRRNNKKHTKNNNRSINLFLKKIRWWKIFVIFHILSHTQKIALFHLPYMYDLNRFQNRHLCHFLQQPIIRLQYH